MITTVKFRPKTSVSRQQAFNLSESIIKSSKDRYKQQESQQVSVNNCTMGFLKTYPHSTPPKMYRINEQDVYNYVRNSISETFKQKTSRSYDLVKQLTSNTVPQKDQAIDRLCKKYSILRTNKRSCFENVQVNIEEITNRYVKSRSKQKQKQEEKQRLKKDIAKNYRYGREKEYEKSQMFFSFDGNQLKNLENKYKYIQRGKQYKNKIFKQKPKQKQKSFNKSKTISNQINNQKQNSSSISTPTQQTHSNLHPYIQLYEKAQKQILQNLSKNEKVQFQLPFSTVLPQTQQWQKNYHNVQKKINIVKQAKFFNNKNNDDKGNRNNKRAIQSARARIGGKINKPDFYLT